jgi:outer membrane murein-binding lipoprotein Lpp
MLAMRSLRIDVVREFCRPFLEAAKQPAPRAEQAIDNIVALMFKCEVR